MKIDPEDMKALINFIKDDKLGSLMEAAFLGEMAIAIKLSPDSMLILKQLTLNLTTAFYSSILSSMDTDKENFIKTKEILNGYLKKIHGAVDEFENIMEKQIKEKASKQN